MGKHFNVETRETCLTCGGPIEEVRFRTFCSGKCRNRHNYLKVITKLGIDELRKRQRDYLYKRKINNGKSKIQCLICGKWYRQVGSHVVQVHKITARHYRESLGFDVKRGQLPDDLRKLFGQQVFDNGTVNNLKHGKKHRFKKGQPGIGEYERSAETMERLSNLHKFNKH